MKISGNIRKRNNVRKIAQIIFVPNLSRKEHTKKAFLK